MFSNRLVFFGLMFVASELVAANAPASFAERLGFEPTEKVLLINADDMGLIASQNRASIDVVNFGLVQSVSLMLPAPGLVDALFQLPLIQNVGIHLTLNSEWKNYRWGPISDPKRVKSLLDYKDRFYGHPIPLAIMGKNKDFETEIEAQILYAHELGLKPTHLDMHMAANYLRPSWFQSYMNIARRFQIPPLAPRWSEQLQEKMRWGSYWIGKYVAPETLIRAEKAGFLLFDDILVAGMPKSESCSQRQERYIQWIKDLKPGVSAMLIHPAYVDEAYSEKILATDPGQILRECEAMLFQSEDLRALLIKEGVKLISWKDVSDVYEWADVQTL